MVSNFYGSTQSRLKTYTADRRVEERNGDIQQAKVYKKLAEEQGDMETADRLAKLGMNIIGKIGATEVPIVNKQGGVAKMSVKEHIMSMIEAGSLSNWWEAIKKIPAKNLSPKARVVQHDIKHDKVLKEMINEKLQKIQEAKLSGILPTARQEAMVRGAVSGLAGPNQYDELIDDLIKTVAGEEATMNEIDTEAEKIAQANAAVASSIQTEKLTKGVPKQAFDVETLTTEQSETQNGQRFVSAGWFNVAKATEFKKIFEYFNSPEYPEIQTKWSNIDHLRPALRSILEREGLYLKQK